MTRLLYVTPELVLTETFRRTLETIYSQGELSRIAIDEAHCISEWGHDFRPAYCHLSHFRLAYPTVPLICLTATAPPSVRADIIKTLGLNPASTKTLFMRFASHLTSLTIDSVGCFPGSRKSTPVVPTILPDPRRYPKKTQPIISALTPSLV